MKTNSVHFRSPRGLPRARSRGSLLIVAMILSAVIGLSLVSYLQLSRTALNVSNRAFYHNAAVNLAEQGVEEAMYSVNQKIANASYTWTGWTISGANCHREWSGVALGQNSTASYRVYVYGYDGVAPTVVSRARVTLADGGSAPIEKWIEVQLRKTSKFANGLVAKTSVTFNGNNATVDSWNSDPDLNVATAAIPFSAAVKNDHGSVGSISVSVGAVAVNNADIWGYVSTGGSAPSVGSTGLIGPFGTSSGTVDPTHVSTDFTASFDPVTAPSGSYSTYSGSITGSISLPRAGIDTTMGTGDYAGYYMITADSVNFNNATLTITDKVVLKLTNTLTAIDIGGGSGALNISTGAALQVYGSGDFKIAGNGVMNGGSTTATANQPINCQFYGTKTSGVQAIDIKGNGVLSAVIYAPQGTVKINGNGDVCGSIVANDITCVGNAYFHYDESLANFGGNNPLRISKWKELTSSADRATYAGVINW